MTEPLDELYFRWLCSQIMNVKQKNPRRVYWRVLKQLHIKEFVWIIPNDDNRLEDGRDLRQEFVEQQGLDDVDPDWMILGCSMLEMLIGLARRLNFETNGPVDEWFWRMLENLGLGMYNDGEIITEDDISEILDDVIWRTYEPDGTGGMFPLRNPKEDQTNVEIWYQLSAYLLENGG